MPSGLDVPGGRWRGGWEVVGHSQMFTPTAGHLSWEVTVEGAKPSKHQSWPPKGSTRTCKIGPTSSVCHRGWSPPSLGEAEAAGGTVLKVRAAMLCLRILRWISGRVKSHSLQGAKNNPPPYPQGKGKEPWVYLAAERDLRNFQTAAGEDGFPLAPGLEGPLCPTPQQKSPRAGFTDTSS